MSKLTKEDVAKMTQEEREYLASRMFSPLRCGGAGYQDGKYYLVLGGKRCFAKEINKIIRDMNSKWSDEALKPYLYDEDK